MTIEIEILEISKNIILRKFFGFFFCLL